MQIGQTLRSQFHAALDMLQQCIERCPQPLWADSRFPAPLWRVAYHALFYAHLYLHATEQDFKPWREHRPGLEGMSNDLPEATLVPYAPAQLLAFIAVCRELIDVTMPALSPEAPSGFYWLPFSKLELQIYNIRHIQQHAGELMERLGARAGIEVDWVGQH